MSFRIYIITMQSRLLCYSLPHNDSKEEVGGGRRRMNVNVLLKQHKHYHVEFRINIFARFYDFPFMKKKKIFRVVKYFLSILYLFQSAVACGLLLCIIYYLFVRLWFTIRDDVDEEERAICFVAKSEREGEIRSSGWVLR